MPVLTGTIEARNQGRELVLVCERREYRVVHTESSASERALRHLVGRRVRCQGGIAGRHVALTRWRLLQSPPRSTAAV